ncbi:MAG TPA: hypothetical protein VK943_15055, partial [Arenibaculum sp.]|nr:hypothetical protein [Arenibaculum sp.]
TAVSTPDVPDPRAEPGLSGTFHDISAEPDHIDRLIADINGEPLRRSGKTGPASADHDIPGHFHELRRARRTGT